MNFTKSVIDNYQELFRTFTLYTRWSRYNPDVFIYQLTKNLHNCDVVLNDYNVIIHYEDLTIRAGIKRTIFNENPYFRFTDVESDLRDSLKE